MALVVKDRVKENTTTTGTANLTLGGAVYGFQSFSVIGNGNTTYYAIYDSATGDWEVGLGTYSTTGPTLSRDTVLESSNAGSKVSFGAGSKDVFCTYPAERSVYLDGAGSAVTLLDVGTLGVGTANITTANITSGTVSTTPASSTDLVNKAYVDTLVSSGITYHTPVKYEVPDSTGNLNATYNNGTAGVGATLTNAGTLVAFTPDGVVAQAGDRILVYNQTNQFENGVYTVTTVGDGSTPWVLTRATDADTYALKSPNGLGEGDAFFITSGNTGAGETYVCNTVGTITFGTTAITFAQVSTAQVYSAGTGLTLTGTQFSITPTGTAGTYGSASQVPVLTTNASGQVTSVTNTAIAISAGAVSGLAPSATTDTTNASNITSGTLPSARLAGSYTGITGVGTLTAGTWNADTIAAAYGGTGQSSYTVGDLLYASGTSALSKLADVAYGNVLLSGGAGTAPSYGKVNLTDHITGTLAVVNGGTGATTASGARSNLGLVIGTDIPSPTGTGASGTWNINVTGSAGSAGTATTAAYATYAGYVANTVTFNNSGAGAASGNGFNGSGALTVSYNTIGAPSTTGSGASGTWGIDISGNAATATSAASATTATSLTNFTAATSGNPSGVDSPTTLDVVGYCSQAGLPFSQSDGGLYTAGYSTSWYHQIFGDFRSGQIAVRGKNSGTWQAWRTVLDSSNYSSYALPLSGGTMTGTITGGSGVADLVTGNYAGALRGYLYNDTSGFGLLTYNGNWAVRVDYGTNSVYIPGIGYSAASLRAPIFYDSDNTAFYLDPASNVSAALAGSVGLNTTNPINSAWGTASTTKQLFVYGNSYAVFNLRADDVSSTYYSMGAGDGRFYAAYDNNAGNHRLTFYGSFTGFNNVTSPSYNIHLAGTGYATSDWRAPIFYDSDNTAYYVNPNGTSYLYGLTTAIGIVSGGNNGFYNDVYYGGTRNPIWAFGNATSYGLSYFQGAAGLGGVDTIGIHPNGVPTGSGSVLMVTSSYTQSLGSMRAPLFYDSDNTSYYVDPAGVSNLATINTQNAVSNITGGLRNVMPGGGAYTTAASTVSGAIVVRLPTNLYPMIRFTVKVYTYDGLSFDINCGGHTSSGTWYNTFAWMATQYRPAMNVRFTYDGTYVYVYIGDLDSSWSYPQVFITDVQVGYYVTDYSYWDDGWSISFNNSTYNSISATHTVYPPTSTGNNTNPAYASIYYDANSTAYYVDPAASSVLNTIYQVGVYTRNAAGAGYLSGNYSGSETSGTTGAIYTIGGSYYPTSTSFNSMYGIGYCYADGIATGISGASQWGMYVNASGVNNVWLGGYTGAVISTGDHRGTIFYDYNNTGYYCDPASTSSLNAVYTNVLYSYGNVTAYYSSDRKFKENIRPISNALDIVLAVGGKLFDWTDEYLADNGGENAYLLPKQSFGIVAQDLLPHLPQAIRTRQDGSLAVDYEKLSAVAFEAVKILEARVAQLEARQ